MPGMDFLSGAPHAMQKVLSAAFCELQCEQVMNCWRGVFDDILAPHSAQKSLAGSFSTPHEGHLTRELSFELLVRP